MGHDSLTCAFPNSWRHKHEAKPYLGHSNTRSRARKTTKIRDKDAELPTVTK